VQGIADLIINPGLINVDFADVRTVMSEMGMAMMGTGVATGPDRAREAAEKAINSPLLEDINLQGARGILVNVSASDNLTLGEFNDVGEAIEEFASDEATVVVGTVIDPSLGDEVRVTVVVTGLGGKQEMRLVEPAAKAVAKEMPSLASGNSINYDIPTTIRQGNTLRKAAPSTDLKEAPELGGDLDYLDIPAFLRRQAD
jgi:cell division protein FtsZ